jgi:hypothetical protein
MIIEHTQYQIWAVDRRGKLIHAGPARLAIVGPSVARRLEREWQAWADGIAAAHPECPTAQSRRKTVALIIHPCGKPEAARRYSILPRRR